MPVFFTKKQKAEFRKRKRRSQDAAKKNGVVDKPGQDQGEKPDQDHKSPLTDPQEYVVTVPKDLSAVQAKKFRKEARRKAKSQGQAPDQLQFVVQGETAEIPTDSKPKPKKRKQAFPCLNDLVREEATVKANQQREQAYQQAEEALSADYKSRYVALDCEMVGIGTDGKKSVLARVSIVDWDGTVLLDTFVRVPTRVTDFRTHVSGVTARHIGSGAMKEAECRQRVAALIKGKILVGHALKNDLHALLLTHPRADLRDTAKYRPFQKLGGAKWRPRKLRDLVQEHLGLSIQQEGQAHDSIQDAAATMRLFRSVRQQWEQSLEEKKSSRKRKAE